MTRSTLDLSIPTEENTPPLKSSYGNYNVLELCAGGGGLALGLHWAGFVTRGLLEYNKEACNTLRMNFDPKVVHEVDITSVTASDFINKLDSDIHLLAGGIPCQPYSVAGNKLGLNDPRGSLFYSFVDFLKALQPPLFIIENVAGLSYHKHYTFIVQTLREAKYNIYPFFLKSHEFGVPQHRKRLFITGIRSDFKAYYTPPCAVAKHTLLCNVEFDSEHANDILGYANLDSFRAKCAPLFPLRQGETLRNVSFPTVRFPGIKDFFLRYPRVLDKSYNGYPIRMSLKKPCWTVCASSFGFTHQFVLHPIYNRPFTLGEFARIQTFPKEYKFTSYKSCLVSQVGNAVPPYLAYHVGRSLYHLLDKIL